MIKMRDLLKESNSPEEKIGEDLLSKGWTIKISYYIPSMVIKSPTGEKTSFEGNDADEILNNVKHGMNEKNFVLGYLKKNNLI